VPLVADLGHRHQAGARQSLQHALRGTVAGAGQAHELGALVAAIGLAEEEG
jgi:hypothetical protein